MIVALVLRCSISMNSFAISNSDRRETDRFAPNLFYPPVQFIFDGGKERIVPQRIQNNPIATPQS